MSKDLRWLRIGWTIACGLSCLLFFVLWVRSYWRYDLSTLVPNHSLASIRGQLLWDTPLAVMPVPGSSASVSPPMRFGTYTFKLNEVVLMSIDPHVAMYGEFAFSIPTWTAVLTTAAFGAIPWLRFRFSLRTLLVATTLIAAALGTIVYAWR